MSYECTAGIKYKGKNNRSQISLKAWKELEKKLSAFNIAKSIKTGYFEMLQIESGELKPKSFEQFLNEL